MAKGYILSPNDKRLIDRDLADGANSTAGRFFRDRRRVNSQSRRGSVYNGDFAVSRTSLTTCLMASGYFEAGELVVLVPDTAFDVPDDLLTVDGTAFVYVESYGNRLFGSWTVVTTALISSERPSLELRDIEGIDKWIYPFVCGELGVVNGQFTTVRQQQYGSHKAAGVLV